jgi:structural maintenance of chromosome 1
VDADCFRSLDLAPQYDAAKAAQDKATEASTANYAKKRGMLNDAKHFKEQRDEVRQWERMRDAKVRYFHLAIKCLTLSPTTAFADFAQDDMIKRHLLWRLYHITNEINESTRQVEEANEKLTELRTSVVGYSERNIVLRATLTRSSGQE